MEIILALVVLCAALWWFFFRDEKKTEVETPVVRENEIIEATVELAPAVVAATVVVADNTVAPMPVGIEAVMAAPVTKDNRDLNKDGVVSAEEKAVWVEKLDLNKDGVVDASEKKVAKTRAKPAAKKAAPVKNAAVKKPAARSVVKSKKV